MATGTARYSFGADEHIFVELSEEMSLEAFFKGLAITTALAKKKVPGVTEICPANASYQVKFDPDVTHPNEMMKLLHQLERDTGSVELELNTRIIEFPVLYNDPWTRETLMRFRERHQEPGSTDIEYAARINRYDSVDAVHRGAQWFALVRVDGGLRGWAAFLVPAGGAREADRSAEVLAAPHRHSQAHGWPRRLLRLHLLGARRGRLPDVRHHAGAHLRPGPGTALSARLHVPVPARRYRQVQAHRSRGVRSRRRSRSRPAASTCACARSDSR